MWSKNPTPVVRVPAPVPSSASPRRMSVSRVVRVMSAARVTSAEFSTTRARLHRLGVHRQALGPRQRGAGDRERRRRRRSRWTWLTRRRNTRGVRPDAKRAAPFVGRQWFEPAT